MQEQKKKYLTLSERIQKLRSQGLLIYSQTEFVDKINEIGYYKLINGYRDVFLDNNKQYYKSTKFEEIVALYNFDNNLKSITLKMIFDFEVNMKSLISEQFSNKYGINDNNYFKIENFNILNKKEFENFKTCFFKEKNKIVEKYNTENKILNEAVINYYTKYNTFPLYIVFKIATFGNMSIFYSKMKEPDKIEIAKNFNVFAVYLENYLRNMNLFRNVCAHNERLFCFRTQNAIRMKIYKDYYKKLNIPLDTKSNTFKYGIKDYFSLLIMLKNLISGQKFDLMVKQIKKELKILKKEIQGPAYNNVMHRLGFNKDWFKITKVK